MLHHPQLLDPGCYEPRGQLVCGETPCSMCGYGKACHAHGNMGHLFTPWNQAEMMGMMAADRAEEEELKAELRAQLEEAFAEERAESRPAPEPWLMFLARNIRIILALPLIWLATKVAGTGTRVVGGEQ